MCIGYSALGQAIAPPDKEDCRDKVTTKGGRSVLCRVETIMGQVIYFTPYAGSNFGNNALPADSVALVETSSRSTRKILEKSGLFPFEVKEIKIEREHPIVYQKKSAFFFLPMVGYSYWLAEENADPTVTSLNSQMASALQKELKIGYTFKGGFGPFLWGDLRQGNGKVDNVISYAKHYSYGLGAMYHVPFERSHGSSAVFLGLGKGTVELNFSSSVNPNIDLGGGMGTSTVLYAAYACLFRLSGGIYGGGDVGLVYGKASLASTSLSGTESLTRLKALAVLAIKI